MQFQYFSNEQIFPLIISTIILISSVLFFNNGKLKISIVLLLLGSIGLGYFIANLDPFLNLWDEQYHALVAKNLSINFLKPTLYSNPILEYDYRDWTANNIWLHKQPLFLWQIAISIKLFGVNTLAVRFPSIILHAITILFIFRIGKISVSDRVGFYGALFFATAYYPLELISGHLATDHNDISFLFYITASFWAWFEYQYSNKKYYLILIGLFSGCAILVKWLVGLLIYAVWFLAIGIAEKDKRRKIKTYSPLVISLTITILTFLPWQFYILSTFPLESNYEFSYNTKHLFETIENHGGNMWFHFNAFKEIYGSGFAVPFIYLLGLIILLKNTTSYAFRIAIISALTITYFFYSIASTKMISYCIIVSPFFFLGIGGLIDSIFNFLNIKLKNNKLKLLIKSTIPLVICFFLLNISKIQNHHTGQKPNDNGNRKAELDEMVFINKLPGLLGIEKYVVFNANMTLNGNIPMMFFTNYVAYDIIPTETQIELVYSKDYKVAILDDGNLPDYIKNKSEIVKIKTHTK